jgi:hypothetical protein
VDLQEAPEFRNIGLGDGAGGFNADLYWKVVSQSD